MTSETSPKRYSIAELSMLAGVTPRTVRFYIGQGLIDRPEGEKRGAHYVQRHLAQLLMIRRWTDAGMSLDRVRELIAGAPADPAPRRVSPGAVEVWSRVTVVDGLEVHVEPGRAGLNPDELRALIRGIRATYRQVRGGPAGDSTNDPVSNASRTKENNDE